VGDQQDLLDRDLFDNEEVDAEEGNFYTREF
jgi:hypothetical protein